MRPSGLRLSLPEACTVSARGFPCALRMTVHRKGGLPVTAAHPVRKKFGDRIDPGRRPAAAAPPSQAGAPPAGSSRRLPECPMAWRWKIGAHCQRGRFAHRPERKFFRAPPEWILAATKFRKSGCACGDCSDWRRRIPARGNSHSQRRAARTRARSKTAGPGMTGRSCVVVQCGLGGGESFLNLRTIALVPRLFQTVVANLLRV